MTIKPSTSPTPIPLLAFKVLISNHWISYQPACFISLLWRHKLYFQIFPSLNASIDPSSFNHCQYVACRSSVWCGLIFGHCFHVACLIDLCELILCVSDGETLFYVPGILVEGDTNPTISVCLYDRDLCDQTFHPPLAKHLKDIWGPMLLLWYKSLTFSLFFLVLLFFFQGRMLIVFTLKHQDHH